MLKDNLFHGKGIMYFNNGDIYSGKKIKNSILIENKIIKKEWKENKFNGKGIYEVPCGCKYSGKMNHLILMKLMKNKIKRRMEKLLVD